MSDESRTTERRVHLVRITPQSKLLFGDDSSVGNYQQTLDYVPGSAIRGAVAQVLLGGIEAVAPTEEQQAAYRHVFEHPQPPLFSHCYPSGSRAASVLPFPLTARTCKHYPRYPRSRPRAGDRPRHGVFDTLVEQFAYELASDPRFPHRGDLLPQLRTAWANIEHAYQPRCPTCQGKVEPIGGYYQLDRRDRPGPADEPRVSRATHVGINRARGVAEDTLLFTQETLEPAGEDGPIYYLGRVVVAPDYLAEDAEQQKPLLPGLRQVTSIGRGRSRGLGQVRVDVTPQQDDDEPSPLEALQKRVERLNERICQALSAYAADDARLAPAEGTFFALTLCSEAILSGVAGQPAAWPVRAEQALAARFPFYRLRSWARTDVVGGWDNANRAPRRTRLSVRRGSVYLYFAPGVQAGALAAPLLELELDGIGEERERGCGQVVVCAPFHLQLAAPVPEVALEVPPEWPPAEVKRRMERRAQRGEVAALSWMAERTLKAVAQEQQVPIPSTQAQLLLRVASQTASVEEVKLWVRVQMARQPEAWGESTRLGEHVLEDLETLQGARDPMAAVRAYAGQFQRWVTAIGGKEEESDE